MEWLTPATAATICAATLVPWITSFIKQERWKKKTKQAVSIAVAVVCTAVDVAVVEELSWTVADFAPHFGAIWVGAQAAYLSWWEGGATERTLASVTVGRKLTPERAYRALVDDTDWNSGIEDDLDV